MAKWTAKRSNKKTSSKNQSKKGVVPEVLVTKKPAEV